MALGKQEHNLRALLDLLDLPMVVHWPNKERVLLGWLIGRADEHGEGWADPGVIGGAVWPGRPGLSKATRIRQTLAEMARIRVNGRRLIVIEDGRYRLLPEGGPSCPDPVPIRSATRTALSRSGPPPIKGRARARGGSEAASPQVASSAAVDGTHTSGCSGRCDRAGLSAGGSAAAGERLVPLPRPAAAQKPRHSTPLHADHFTHHGGGVSHDTDGHSTSPHSTGSGGAREGDNGRSGGAADLSAEGQAKADLSAEGQAKAEAAEDGRGVDDNGERLPGARGHLARGYPAGYYDEFDRAERILGEFTGYDWDCAATFVAQANRRNGALDALAHDLTKARDVILPRGGREEARRFFFWAIGLSKDPRTILNQHGKA